MASRGFSLVEIAIILGVVGLLLAVALPIYQAFIDRARVRETVVAIGSMQQKIRDYRSANGAFPDSLADVSDAGMPLSDKRDPWGTPYEYLNLNNLKGNGLARKDKKLAPLNSDFDLYSRGKDQLTNAPLSNSAARDDIVRARDGRFIGLAEEFDP